MELSAGAASVGVQRPVDGRRGEIEIPLQLVGSQT